LIWTTSEWDQAVSVMLGFGWPSFIMTTFLMITWIVFPSKRKQQYLLCFNVCIWFISWNVLFANYQANDMRKVGCIDNARPSKMSDGGYCLMQSMFLHFFVLAAAAWWTVISVDLWMKIVMLKKLTPAQAKALRYAYHGFVWVMSAHCTALAALSPCALSLARRSLAACPRCSFAVGLSARVQGLASLFWIIALGLSAYGRSTIVPWCNLRRAVLRFPAAFAWAHAFAHSFCPLCCRVCPTNRFYGRRPSGIRV
jgi:hypothetical protein